MTASQIAPAVRVLIVMGRGLGGIEGVSPTVDPARRVVGVGNVRMMAGTIVGCNMLRGAVGPVRRLKAEAGLGRTHCGDWSLGHEDRGVGRAR